MRAESRGQQLLFNCPDTQTIRTCARVVVDEYCAFFIDASRALVCNFAFWAEHLRGFLKTQLFRPLAGRFSVVSNIFLQANWKQLFFPVTRVLIDCLYISSDFYVNVFRIFCNVFCKLVQNIFLKLLRKEAGSWKNCLHLRGFYRNFMEFHGISVNFIAFLGFREEWG